MSERKGVLLRLDPAVHDALARWAADELRGANAQIEFLVRRALAELADYPATQPRCASPVGRGERTRPKPPPGSSRTPAEYRQRQQRGAATMTFSTQLGGDLTRDDSRCGGARPAPTRTGTNKESPIRPAGVANSPGRAPGRSTRVGARPTTPLGRCSFSAEPGSRRSRSDLLGARRHRTRNRSGPRSSPATGGATGTSLAGPCSRPGSSSRPCSPCHSA